MIATLCTFHARWLVRARTVLATVGLVLAVVALAGLLALHDAPASAQAGAAIVWLVASIGGLLAGARVLAAEHVDGGLQGVLLAPVDRRDVFLARSIVLAILIAAATLGTLLVVGLFLPGLPGRFDPRLGLAALAAGLGLGPLGALTAWASLSTDVGELLATALALPLAAPLIVGGLHATEHLLAGQTGWEASLTFAAGYATSVAALCYLVSEPVTEVA